MSAAARKQAGGIEDLKALKDGEIDLSDLPEVHDWSDAVVGKFYRPIKESITIRLDADVLAWLRGQGKGYQSRINAILRAAMRVNIRRRRS